LEKIQILTDLKDMQFKRIDSSTDTKWIENEINLLKKFQNQNIIQYLDSFKIQTETQFLSGYTYYVVTEYYKVYIYK